MLPKLGNPEEGPSFGLLRAHASAAWRYLDPPSFDFISSTSLLIRGVS